MKIDIEYNGEYPNLCSGNLAVTIDGERYEFPDYCLSSGGSVYFDSDWNAEVTTGEWKVSKWPKGFPEELKPAVLDAINEKIPHGCCGGCI